MIAKPLRICIAICAVAIAFAASAQGAGAGTANRVELTVRAGESGSPFPHYWENMFGSGRAVLALRDSYRRDLRFVKAATGFQYVRFHGILNDEVGFYDVDKKGRPVFNFSYVDQIYDGLLADGVRPYIELSFMPQKLARDPKQLFSFWYKPNISPPRAYARWDAMIDAFVRHLVERYGIDEVSTWYFEVWNEPNIGFWGGRPRQPSYFRLYDHTARAIKNVSPQLRVGGPSTAQAAWTRDFIEHCKKNGVPVDFVSSHVYANDLTQDVFKNHIPVSRDQMVCRSVRKVSDEIQHSSMPRLPLIFSEYNASYANEPDVTDTVYMGPWLATTISQCDGLTEAMSYWSFSDVFEEGGVVRTPFYGGFGVLAEHGIAKPAFNAFALLHRLGETRLPSASDSALITKRSDGALVLALWNYAAPDGTGGKYHVPRAPGPPTTFVLSVSDVASEARATIWRLDEDHGNVLKAFDAMGRPAFPTREQIAALQAAAQLATPEPIALTNGQLEVRIPTHGLALIEIR
ncbi:MAG: glycosyl hydrolase [Steroidobacteraceae bacterium]|jgi:xylan 1,4-beta-xylosidase